MRPTPIPPHLRKGVACSILLAFVMACNHFNRDAPGVIEEQLRLDPKLDVTPERYSTMTALYFLPSSVVPLLLGLLSAVPESQGGVPSVVVFVGVCVTSGLGNFVAAIGAERASFPTLLAGRGIAGAVYEAVDMTPLGFIPQLLPGRWGTVSGFINGALRLGSVAAFGLLPIAYVGLGGDGGDGARAVFWTCALVGGCMVPAAAMVNRIATGRANALLGLPTAASGTEGEPTRGDPGAIFAADGAMTTAASTTPPPDGLSAAGAALHALRSVPSKFWVYAGGSACMYGAVVPFWLNSPARTRVLDRQSRDADADPGARVVRPLGAHRRRRGQVPPHLRAVSALVRVGRVHDRGVAPRTRVGRRPKLFRAHSRNILRVL